jgi:MFS family permease
MIYTFSVFLPEMHQSLGWSQPLITAAYSFSIAVRAVASTAVGWWVDRRGAAALMTVGAIGGALILVAWSAISTPLELFAVFLGVGITTSAILYEPAFAIVVRTYTERRDSRLLTVTILGGFASTVFLPAAGALVAWLGWRHALVALAVLPLALLVRDPRRGPGAHDPGGTARKGIRAAARMAAASTPYRWLTLASFLISISLVFVNVYLVSYLLGAGYTLTVAAAATGSLGILSVLGRIFLSQAAQRVGLARLTGTLVGFQALAVIPLLSDARAVPCLVAFILLFGAGFGVVTLARARLLADRDRGAGSRPRDGQPPARLGRLPRGLHHRCSVLRRRRRMPVHGRPSRPQDIISPASYNAVGTLRPPAGAQGCHGAVLPRPPRPRSACPGWPGR